MASFFENILKALSPKPSPFRGGNEPPKTAGEKKTVKIFISYASEDKGIAQAIENIIKRTFAFAPLEIKRDVEIDLGANWIQEINTLLDNADILLVLFTETMKFSHSYTGYEIGWFAKSREIRPKGTGEVERIYLPLCIGADIPETMHYVQGVKLKTADIFKIYPKSNAIKYTAASVTEENPAYLLLKRISKFVMHGASLSPDIDTAIRESAADLYNCIYEYLQNRVSSEIFPERKIIIHCDARPSVDNGHANFSKSRVSLLGQSFDIFGIGEIINHEFFWEDLVEQVHTESAKICLEGLRSLVGGVLEGSGDNYYTFTTPGGGKAFRVFVSRITTYVNKKTDIHIDIIEKMKIKEYGDPDTTRLLRAISIGLKFRFLVLEKGSAFRPGAMDFPTMDINYLKPKITELRQQIDLIRQESRDANLRDPDFFELIWGRKEAKEKVANMMQKWDAAREKLYSTSGALILSDSSNFDERKAKFIAALMNFCIETEDMNRDFTSKALERLQDHIHKTLEAACDVA